MSIRNHYPRDSVPYTNSQPYYGHSSRNDVRLFPSLIRSELDEEVENNDSILQASALDSTTNEDSDIMDLTNVPGRLSHSYELEEQETDISLEDLRLSPSQLLSPREVESRQLAYLSLPDLYQLPPGLSYTISNSGRRIRDKSPTASPSSYSIESVAMDLEETEGEDIFMLDDIPTEDVEDETESTGDYNSEDFVNMRVKVERKPYPTKAVKVTVSVQPPSEVEDDCLDELLLREQFDDELLSATSAEADIVSSESEVCSESQPSEDESEGESVDEEIEEEESICSSSREDDGDESSHEDEGNNSDDFGSESGVESEDPNEELTKKITKESPIILKTDERERKTEEAVEKTEPKDPTQKMLGLLDDAIDDSEKVKVKIVEEVTLAKLQEAEAIAIAEGEKLAAQVMESSTGSLSPLVKVKGSVVSGVQGAMTEVSSAVGSVKSKITATEKEGKDLTEKVASNVVEAKNELGGSIAKVEKGAVDGAAAVEESIRNAKTEVKDLDKRIHHEASNIAGDIEKSGEAALSELKSLVPGAPSTTTVSKTLSPPSNFTTDGVAMVPPPPNSIVVANVIVHETPKSSQSPTLLPKSTVTLPNASTVSTGISTMPTNITAEVNGKAKPTTIVIPPVNSSTIITASTDSQQPASFTSQISVPENSPKSTDSKFPEKEDYLSVCAADSMDSSDDDEDIILRKQKTKAETEEERRAVELAKDKLMEDWKSTRRESIDELDDKFQHILEDMVSEFNMEPVIPVLPKKLKEAVHVSDEEPNSANSSFERSSESVLKQTIKEESFEEEENLPSPCGIYGDSPFATRQKSIQSSSSEISRQNSWDSQESHSSSSRHSSASRKLSSKSIRSPIYAPPIPTAGRVQSPRVSSLSIDKTEIPRVSPSRIPKLNPPTSKFARTPSAKSLKVQDSVEPPIRPLSQSRQPPTPSKPLSRTASTKSLKTSNVAPSKSKQDNPQELNSSISKSPTRITSTNGVTNKVPTSKINSVEKKPTTPTNSSKPSMTGNSSPGNNAIGKSLPPEVHASPKSLSSHSTPSKPKAEENNKNLSSPKNVSKSPSISQHSSLQTDQSMEETNWNMGSADYDNNDLPNFNSNPEGGSDSERDEESPSQRRKWKNSTEIASTLSHYLHLVKTETVENSVTEIIPLITQLLVLSRKSKAEHGLPTMIATLSAVRVLCERLIHVKLLSGEKALRNVDLSWLIRILCKLSADPESKLKPEASFTLAKLVKAAGPELITRPIYFLLVMENEGYGHKRGSQGSKTKAAALDTLTYALLTFPKEEFDDLEEIARWVCLILMHPHRRVRQAALECISVLGNNIGSPDAAVSRFRGYIVQESEQNYNRSDSDGSNAATKSAIKTFDAKGIFDVSAITAISCRIRKRILPLPSPYGLVEYGVKVPTGQELVLILTKMQEEEEDEYEGSTSEDSLHSSVGGGGDHHHSDGDSESESIRMSDLEKSAKEEKVFGKKSKVNGKGEPEEEDDIELITPDVAYILSGKGRVNKQEIVNLNDENANGNDQGGASQQDDKEKRKKALLRKKRQKKRHVERTYSEYEDDSPGED